MVHSFIPCSGLVFPHWILTVDGVTINAQRLIKREEGTQKSSNPGIGCQL